MYESCSVKLDWLPGRVRSMWMGLVIPRSTVGKTLGTYRGLPKIYQGFGAWDSVSFLGNPPFQIFTGFPVTYKFSSFHWSPHNLQVFPGVPEFSEGFHGSKQLQESRMPKPWYIFGKPLYVPRFSPRGTIIFWVTCIPKSCTKSQPTNPPT